MNENANQKKKIKVGPHIQRIVDGSDEVLWRISAVPARKDEKDLAVHHRWLREQGYTRFQQDDEWKFFPEDPDAPDVE
jgi:hypothetical protein